MNTYTRQDLCVMQAWPLERKIRVTQAKSWNGITITRARSPYPFLEARIPRCCWTLHGGHSRTSLPYS